MELGLIHWPQVYKQVAPNGALNPPLCLVGFSTEVTTR